MQEWYLGWEKVSEVSSVQECPHRERGSTPNQYIPVVLMGEQREL